MATHAHDFGRASALPLSAVLASIPSYPRPVIERLVSRLIETLDEDDGDTDVELNGDELDSTLAEDELPADNSHKGSLHWCMPSGDCEDDEDDDPAGGADEAEPEHDLFPAYGEDQSQGPTGYGYEPKRRQSWR